MELVVITAGSGERSTTKLLGEKLAQAAVAALADIDSQARVRQLELRTLAADLVTALTTHTRSPRLDAAEAAILAADGVIAVSPVYNGSYSGLFKLFFDVLDPRVMTARPVLLAATGGSPRHSLMVEHSLLPLFYFFKAEVAPLSVFAATPDWVDSAELDLRVAKATGAFAQRVLFTSAPKALPSQHHPDYDDLLRG